MVRLEGDDAVGRLDVLTSGVFDGLDSLELNGRRSNTGFRLDSLNLIGLESLQDLDVDSVAEVTPGALMGMRDLRRVRLTGIYLPHLLRGSRITGAEEDHDDDGGSGRNSELSLDLTRGDYTVVATNYGRGRIRTGDYMLKIRNEQSCPVQAISGRTTRGQWTHSDCESTRREESYVDYYTFEVTGSQSTRYRIDVDSSVDSYMYLIEGDSPAGTDYLERDDDGGPGRDARITRITEYETGSYTLMVREY